MRFTHVSELEIGEVVVMGYDPDDQTLHWLRHPGLAPPHLVLVDCTVSGNAPQPGTATLGRMTERDGTAIYELGHPDLHTLRLLHNGNGWTIEVQGDASLHRLPDHYERCGNCSELWPCREERLDRAAHQLAAEIDNLCAHCDKPINGAWREAFFDGVTRRRYHLAKKYRGPDGRQCVVALAEAKRSIPDLPEASR